MAFELNDVAPSSSSSSSPSQSEADQEEDASDHDVDQHLADELRAALHLAVGNICRAEDTAEQAFAMSNDAIVALTDLTYHYSTSLFANDLVAFSKHAKRQTVKTDDVLLMARKDPRRMLLDLQRVVADQPDRFADGVRKPKVKERRSGAGAVAARKTAPANKARTESHGSRKPKSNAKGATQRGKPRMFSSSSSSSSDDGSDDAVTLRRKKLDLERTNLDAGAFRGRGTANSDGDLSVIAHKDSFGDSSDSDAERAPGTQKTQAGRRKKPVGKEGRPGDDGTLGRTTNKKAAASSFSSDGDLDGDNNMVIDLADSD